VTADKIGLAGSSRSRMTKAVRVLRSEGLFALASRAADVVRPRVYLDESHIWYSLDLTTLTEPAPLPGGLEVVRGGVDQLSWLDQLDTVNSSTGRARLAGGAVWWCVLQDAQPVFSCWVFSKTAPVLAAPGGWLSLPHGAVVLEDSVTAPAGRGRGIAPAAWRHVAASAAASASVMFTKVAVTNTPSRKAVVKAGYREILQQRHLRIGPVTRTRLSLASTDAALLARGLHGKLSVT